MDDRNSAERLEEARSRASKMLALASALGAEVGPEEISRAALVPIPPIGEFLAALMANAALRYFEGLARIIAGLGDDRVIAPFMVDEVDSTKMTPARRPRRPRPTAADRARAATEWVSKSSLSVVTKPPCAGSWEEGQLRGRRRWGFWYRSSAQPHPQ
jgi:hypothetical protein